MGWSKVANIHIIIKWKWSNFCKQKDFLEDNDQTILMHAAHSRILFDA